MSGTLRLNAAQERVVVQMARLLKTLPREQRVDCCAALDQLIIGTSSTLSYRNAGASEVAQLTPRVSFATQDAAGASEGADG